MLRRLRKDLRKVARVKKAKVLAGFFKTARGEYCESDIFLGVAVPDVRMVARKYSSLSLTEIRNLLQSKIHEERLVALEILVMQYESAKNMREKETIFKFLLKNTVRINNWDLVDLTAPYVIGDFLLNKDKSVLYRLALSKNLWERRIAIVSTFHFIKNNRFDETFKIAELLMNDKHDLIHKAVGWMLREVGKKNQEAEERFLKKHYRQMPRTMLRYTIERLDEGKRRFYLKT